jgi:hypothetical protein
VTEAYKPAALVACIILLALVVLIAATCKPRDRLNQRAAKAAWYFGIYILSGTGRAKAR